MEHVRWLGFDCLVRWRLRLEAEWGGQVANKERVDVIRLICGGVFRGSDKDDVGVG